MLKVDCQSGGFIPWNEICPKKYLSPGIPVDPLWQNSRNLICAIPLGRFAPCLFAMSYELSAICCPHQLSISGAFFMAILGNAICC